MRRYREPGYIAYARRNGGDPILEPVGIRRRPGDNAYIMVCGMGNGTVWIRWYACDVDEARASFRVWLAETWQLLTTDFEGVGITNGMDFKPSKIDWFNIAAG